MVTVGGFDGFRTAKTGEINHRREAYKNSAGRDSIFAVRDKMLYIYSANPKDAWQSSPNQKSIKIKTDQGFSLFTDLYLTRRA